MTLDDMDKRLLGALQLDAQATAQDLGDRLNLSPSQISRRKQRLESAGLITHYTARLDARALGLTVQAFIQVELATHQPDVAKDFVRLVSLRREVISAWTLTGAADYLLRTYADDLAALNRLIHEVLLPHPAVARVQSQIVMDQFKEDAPLPV